MGERLTWSSVASLDIGQAPLNLSDGIGAPIGGDDLHLVGRQGLGNAVGAAAVIVGLEVPVALTIPELIEAGDLG